MSARKRRLWRRVTNPALVLFLAVAAAATLWVIAPLATPASAEEKFSYTPPTGELIRIRAMTALAAGWIFAFGASVGSFLNVVVWRMPRGETLIWRPSRCPRCNAAIRPGDNLPVFGWLKLRGRCRVCRTPISSRYPLVELLTGTLLFGLAVLELFLQGANLPSSETARVGRTVWMPLEFRGELISIFVYHALLVCLLLTWALIEYDRQRAPFLLFAFAIFLGLSGPVAAAVVERIVEHPTVGPIAAVLHPVPWTARPPAAITQIGWPRLLAEPLLGGMVGLVCGVLLRPVGMSASRVPRLLAGMSVVGVFLGWQAVISVALLTSISLLAVAAVWPLWAEPRRSAAWVLLATLVQVTLWRVLADVSPWPGAGLSFLGMLFCSFLIFVAAVATGRMVTRASLYAVP